MQQVTLNFGDIKLKRVGRGVGTGGVMSWLVENIWAEGGTGMLAGPPKTGKTWLIVDLAVSIASGTPFLGKFPCGPGPVVIYSPEGPESCLEDRIRQVADRRGLKHADLEIYLIETNNLSLDNEEDQNSIAQAVDAVKPSIVIFDPLAECFDGDENRSEDVKVMTKFLTRLSNEYGTASLVTHHIVKTAGGKQAGNRMRGSGALFGFGDSYLFLDRLKNQKIYMETVQRNGKPADPCILQLSEEDSATSYAVTEGASDEGTQKQDLGDRIILLLNESKVPLSQRQIRKSLCGSHGKYGVALKELKADGQIQEIKNVGWELTDRGKGTAEELLLSGAVRVSPISTSRTAPVE